MHQHAHLEVRGRVAKHFVGRSKDPPTYHRRIIECADREGGEKKHALDEKNVKDGSLLGSVRLVRWV